MKIKLTSYCLLSIIVLALITDKCLIDAKDYEDEGETEDNLLTKINCKVGDKYEYMMATQSSLLDQMDANLLVKSKLELKCLQKKMWLNQTSGQLINGQLFEARITSLSPVHLATNKAETVTIKSGRIQMAALFASLENMPDSTPEQKKPNLKVGAVNQFFSDFGKSFGELISQLFHKLVEFFKSLINKSKSGPAVRTSGISWKCSKNNEQSRRQKRQSFKSINFGQFGREISAMFELPFTFLQLEDGTVQTVQLSPLESNPSVMHFKRFLAQSFATQLDERKKTVQEQSTLGDHMSHYQMEYDEPDKLKVTPEEYMSTMVRHRAKRSSAHLVSVVRSVKRADMIAHAQNSQGGERNQYRHKTLQLADIEFDAQQVQLVEDNMLVASGGYFHSLLPVHLKEDIKRRKVRSTSNETAEEFDTVLKKYLTMNLEYSMVRITKNRWRRSTDSDQQKESQHVSNRAISTYVSVMRNLANSTSNWTIKTANNLSRVKRQSIDESTVGQNVVCKVIPNKPNVNGQIEREDSNVIKDHSEQSKDDLKECYEYKEFGSGWLKAYFNRSILTGSNNNKPLNYFQTQYKLGAQMLGENMFMGHIDISKSNDASKLRINLFGSEYIDLNLCDIRDKVFSQADKIPLFAENIWFMTNVGINIKYDLQFRVQVPTAVCDDDKGTSNNSVILSRMISDQFNLNQNSKIELGGVFDASFLIFNGEMRLNGNFDMDSNIDFGQSCLSANSLVKPTNVSLDFNYKFFHPLCGEWMEDSWIPKQLSWKLQKAYRNSWFDNVCL